MDGNFSTKINFCPFYVNFTAEIMINVLTRYVAKFVFKVEFYVIKIDLFSSFK